MGCGCNGCVDPYQLPGIQGPQGITGSQGITGDIGPGGNTGSTGPAGANASVTVTKFVRTFTINAIVTTDDGVGNPVRAFAEYGTAVIQASELLACGIPHNECLTDLTTGLATTLSASVPSFTWNLYYSLRGVEWYDVFALGDQKYLGFFKVLASGDIHINARLGTYKIVIVG